MKGRTLAAIGFAAYAIGVISTVPATLVDSGLRRVSDGKLRLVEAQGSVWSGSGRIEIRDPAGRRGIAEVVAWRMRLASLLSGHLVCEVAMNPATGPFTVTLSPTRIEIAGADISLPAEALGLAVPRLALLGLSGELALHVARLSLGREQAQGQVTLQWRAAGSQLTLISPLGDYELELDGEGERIHALLHTVQGPLQLDGNGSWAYGDNPDFLVVAHVPQQHRQQLGPLLRLIAVERDAGSFELQLK